MLFDHLQPLPPTIDLTNRDLWSLSYASSFSGKKIVTVPNIDKYATPSSMLTSGHFGNNQAGQLKVLVVLTSTEIVDKQEPVTPLRPDSYPAPVREEKKRKVKQEGASPALNHGKRIKREENVKKEDGTGNPDQAGQEANIKMKAEESFWAAPYESLTDDERETIADEIVVHEHEVALSEVEDPPDYQKFDSIPNHKGSQCSADDEDDYHNPGYRVVFDPCM